MNHISNPPEILYKYRPFNDNTLSCITKKILWFASPDTFNDPFDGFVAVPKKREYEEFKTVLGHNLSNANPFGDRDLGSSLIKMTREKGTATAITKIRSIESLAEEELERKIKTRGVFSASTKPSNLLMWSHYAEYHRGLCIGYKINYEKLNYAHIRKINYPETYDREILTETDLFDEKTALDKLLTYKSKDWEYEDEWRLILKDELEQNTKGKEMPIVGEIHEIIFGIRMPDSNKETLTRIGGAKLYKMAVPKYRKYELQILPYST